MALRVDAATDASSANIDMALTEIEAPKHETSCRILELPPELRNRIYHYVSLNSLKPHLQLCKMPPMLSVCRQIRDEFSSFYFSVDIFDFERAEATDTSGVYRWTAFTDEKLLKALLVVPYFRQSPKFRGCFGNRKSPVVYYEDYFGPTKTKEQARRDMEDSMKTSRNFNFAGMVFVPVDFGVRVRRVWQWDDL